MLNEIDARFIVIGKIVIYPLIILGLIDFVLQVFTNWEFRLIHKILSALFGEVK